jgi:hypothetical protein
MDVIIEGLVATTGPARLGKARPASQCRILERRLRERILRRTGRRIRNLSVVVENDAIRIGGSCWTFYTKQLAQHAVMALNENEAIHNEIEVIAP